MRTKIALLLMSVALGACSQIDDNEIGLRRVYGEIQDQPVRGLVYYNPWSTDIITFDNQQSKVETDAILPTTDQQRAHIKSVTTVQLDRNSAAKMYRNVGANWKDQIVPSIIRSVQQSEIGHVTAIGLIQKQSDIEQSIAVRLRTILQARGIILTSYQLTDVRFSDDYMDAVEQKATAVQKADAAKNYTVQVQEEANQKVITAKGEAEAMKVQGDALAANSKLVDYEAVKKWDGHLPEQMLGGVTPFINVTK